jgi:hypothetical protein
MARAERGLTYQVVTQRSEVAGHIGHIGGSVVRNNGVPNGGRPGRVNTLAVLKTAARIGGVFGNRAISEPYCGVVKDTATSPGL